jgi:hypothetical protein
MEALTVGFHGTNTLAVVVSENRKLKSSRRCSLPSQQRINLREWLTELTNSEGSNQSRVEITSADSNEDTGHQSTVKFVCCKIVKRLTVNLPGEYSDKPNVKFRTHKLFVTLPGNTRQYIYTYIYKHTHSQHTVYKN